MKQVIIMPGGFHPFHAGHYALYKQAQDAFPGADVYVAATNDTSTRPFPFAVKEKLAKLAGVKPGHFVQVKSPFQAREITANLDPENTQLIFVRSEKDANKPPQAGGVKKDGNPAYLQPLEGQGELAPMNQHAYMAYLPTVEFGPGMTSATEIRTAWPRLNEKRKTALVMSLYPKTQTNPPLAANVVKMLDTAIGTEELNEFAPDEGGGARKFIPWPEFIEQVKQIVAKDFDCVENIVKTTIKARFVPHDPMEFGPTMLYSYYETRAGGRNKGAVSTRGSIQVGKYTGGGLTGQIKGKLLTTFSLLKGHPFERHFDLTFDNIYKIANIILGNTEGALEFKPEGVAEGYFDDEDDEPPYHTRILDRQTKKVIADEGPYETENEAVDRAEAYLAWAKTKGMDIVAQVYQPEHGKNYVTWQVPDEGDYTIKEQGVAEDTNGKLPGFLSYVLANSQGQFNDIEEIEDLFDYAYLSDFDLETIANGAHEEGVPALKWMTPRMAWLLKNINDKSKLAVIKPLAASWMKTVAPAIDKYVKDVLSDLNEDYIAEKISR